MKWNIAHFNIAQEWSDSELQETDPLSAEPVIAAEAVEESGGKEDAQSGISAPIVEKEREEDQDMDTLVVLIDLSTRIVFVIKNQSHE